MTTHEIKKICIDSTLNAIILATTSPSNELIERHEDIKLRRLKVEKPYKFYLKISSNKKIMISHSLPELSFLICPLARSFYNFEGSMSNYQVSDCSTTDRGWL